MLQFANSSILTFFTYNCRADSSHTQIHEITHLHKYTFMSLVKCVDIMYKSKIVISYFHYTYNISLLNFKKDIGQVPLRYLLISYW